MFSLCFWQKLRRETGVFLSAFIDNTAIQAVFGLPLPNGAFDGSTAQYLRELGSLRPILMLPFAPKAAGTYFRQAAMEVLGGQLVRGCHAQGGRDATPYLPTFLAAFLDAEAPPTVFHFHMQAFAANRHFIEAFQIRPIIMLRNLPDMLASFWDMLENDPVARDNGLNCLIPGNFLTLSRHEKAEFILDVVAPWYASYFATWKQFHDDAPDVVHVLRYRDFCNHPAATLHSALEHAGFSASVLECEVALSRVWPNRNSYRYNKGRSGRGREYFSEEHLGKIARLLSYYPKIDSWLHELTDKADRTSPIRHTASAAGKSWPVH
jgi:hypothetical protein